MKNKKVLDDERTNEINNKILSEGYVILNIFLLFFIIIKALIFITAYSSYRLEVILFVVINIYITSKKIYCGTDNPNSVKPFSYALSVSFLLSFIITLINFIKYNKSLTITFICFIITFIVSFILFFLVLNFMKKLSIHRHNTIDKELDD
ncbi:MAG: hypothetical protein K5986_01020 [Clostridium sp.]|nr:hypothetical protein [Clostridium sp.]